MAVEEFWGGSIPWVSAKDMKTPRLHDSMLHVSEKAIGNGTRLAQTGAVLIVVRGMILAHSLPVARAERPIAFNQDIKALTTGAEVDSEFMLHWLRANSQQILGIATESTHGTKRIQTDDLFAVPVALPAVSEQRAIAKALNDVDALLAGLDRLIAKKRDLKQAAMQQFLNGNTRLPGCSSDWETVRLAEVSAFITKGSTPTTYGFEWQSTGVLFLRSECVSPDGLDLAESMFISEEAHLTLRRSAVRSNDLLITIAGNVGRVVRLPEDFGEANINQHIARIRIIDESIHPSWVYHYLSQPRLRRHFEKITTGQAYPQVSLAQVRNAVIPRPTIGEQQEISASLDDMDEEIARLVARRCKTGALKQAMMQELLTGRIRLI